MSLSRQQFIDIWTQLDALYVEISSMPSGVAALFGNYAESSDFTRNGETSALIALGTGNYADFAAAMGDGATRVDLGQAALAVNLAFIELADDYVAYLQAGGEPILDIAKLRGPGDPGQSFHDNILGNLNSGAFGTRFPDTDYDLDGTNYEIDDIVSPETAEFHARPIYSGYAAETAAKNGTVAFDLGHDVSFASGMLDAYEQGFETSADSFSGSVVRVASGTDSITSFDGSYHGVATGSVYTRFDGYRTDFGDGYVTKIAIYLDPSIASGEGFDYSVASTATTNDHRRDFIFHVAKDTGTGDLLIGASNGTNFAVREDLDTLPNNAVVGSAGWYTFEHYFYETSDGSLAVAMSVYDDAGNLVFNEIRNTPSDIVDSNVGGNRYGWFTVNTVTGGLPIDGVSVQLSEPIGALIYDSSLPLPHTIEGSPYDDIFVAGPGNDQIDGNGGSDTYDASATTNGVVVDLDDNPFSGTVSGDGFAFGGDVGIDGLTSIENVRGGAGDDVVNGSDAANTLFASGGDDSFDGDDGVDTYDASGLTGSVDVDLGAASNQAVKSAGGTDTLTDVENVVGTAEGDTITGNAGVNTLEGGGGDDTLTGGAGGDQIDGGSGSDTAVYTENLAAAGISYNAITGEWGVAVASGSDTLTGVERLDFGDGHSVYLVGGGSELTFEAAAALAQDGDAIYLSAGTHNISAQVVLGNDIDIVGAGQSDTVLHIGFNTTTSGDARGAILINAGANVDISNLTLDGEGQTVWQGIRNHGDLDVTSVTFQEIKYLSAYAGTAIAAIGGTTTNVESSHFEEIGRIGVHLFGDGTMSNSTYVGKGAGDWLDYALDIGGGGTAVLTGNTISDNVGVASSDGSTSAGVLVSTYFGSGSALTLNGNEFDDNTTSVYSGYNATDTSTVDFGAGNTYGGDDVVIVGNGTYINTETQDARFNWNGGDAANATGDQAISGAALPDDLSGGAGDDVITGGGGDDTIDGGEGSETMVGDTAQYAADLSASDIVFDTDHWDVSAGAEGNDTLTNVERVVDGNGETFLLVGAGGYATIQDAIDAASDDDTILIAAGSYNESLSITKSVKLIGQDIGNDGVPDVHITPVTAHGISISGDIDNGGGGAVIIRGISVSGATGSGINVASNTQLASLTVQDSALSDNSTFGIGAGSSMFGVDAVNILNSTFEDNGQGGTEGTGDIVLFGFTGNALIQDVQITSSKDFLDGLASKGDNAIQINGRDPANYDVTEAIGTVTLENVTTTGSYHKPQVLIQGYSDLDGLSFTNVNLSGSSNWGDLLFIDPISTPGDGTPGSSADNPNGAYAGAGGSTTLDLSGVAINNDGPNGALVGAIPSLPDGFDTRVRGSDANDTITGTAGNDLLNDLAEGGNDYGGDDTVYGGEGNDGLVGGVGEDHLHGGEGDDTYFVTGNTDHVHEAVGEGNDTVIASGDFALEAGEEVENLIAATGTDPINLTGNELAQTITGNTGNNVLDGQGGADIIDGGAGDDTITGGAGEDNIDGGAGIDTAVYAASSTDAEIVFNGGNWEITIGGETDVLTGVERVTFTGDTTDVLLIGGGSEFNLNDAVAAADVAGGDTILIGDGNYNSGGSQVVIDRDVTIKGQGRTTTTLEADFDTAASGGVDAGAWLLVQAGKTLTISDLTLDGTGQTVGAAIRVTGAGATADVDSVGFNEIKSGSWDGRGIAAMDGGHVDVEDSVFTNIGRIGVHFRDDTTGSVTNSTYTGKGPGNHLDYGVELGAGAVATLTGNTITGNTGEAISDGSTSAAVLVTTYFGEGTDATLNGNVFTGNTNSVAAGYDENDTSTVDFGTGNTYGNDIVVIGDGTYENTETVSAKFDWQGGSAANAGGDNAISGGTAGDELNGGEGADEILGNGGDDTIKGEGGNDTITGGAGDDDIDGGAGIDTVVFAGNLAEYAPNLATMEIEHIATGDTDSITGVEIFQFDDQRILLVGGASGEGFATIQDALASAQPNDVILVAPGTYDGPINISVNGVVLVAAEADSVIIDGPDNGNAFTIAAGVDDVVIGGDGLTPFNFGFDILVGDGAGSRGIYLEGGNNGLNIIGNDIDVGTTGTAVESTGAGVTNSQFLLNSFEGNSPAPLVYINGETSLGAANESINVDFQQNEFVGGANSGLLLGNEARDSDISGNTFSGMASYAQLEVFEGGNTIDNNTFEADGPVAISDFNGEYSEAALAGDSVPSGNTFDPGWVYIEGEDNVFTSIQAAIDAAGENDIIHVGPGTFNENLSITTQGVSIVGEPGAILMGTLATTPAWDGTDPLNEFFEANHPSYTGTTGLTIGADGVSVSGMQFSGFAVGISLGTSNGVSVTGNDFIDNVTGVRKGEAAAVTNVTISNNEFSQGINGVNVYAHESGSGAFDGVTMDGNSFSALSEKGMYFEQLSNAALDGNIFNDVGNYGRISPPFGGTDGEFGQAIDINLKYETYSNVVFNNTEIDNSGNSNKDGAASPGSFGAAIGVKIRDDSGYAATPADFTGQIEFNGGSIDGTSTGIRVGEPGKDNDGPNVLINGVLIENATESDVDNATDPANGGVVTVNMAVGQGTLDASASISPVDVTGTADSDIATTGTGDDSFEGLVGDDTFNGGAGTDTLVLNGDIADYSIDLSAGTVTDDVAGDGDEGEDTFTDVEIIEFGTGGRVLIVGAGGFDTLQQAVDAAAAGDTIMLSDNGSVAFSEDVTIGAHLTGLKIVGAQQGNATTGRDLAAGTGESTIDGRLVILADGVVIDGVRILDGSPGGSFENAGVHVQADNVTVKNSLFFNQGGGTGNGSRGIINSAGNSNGLTVMSNAFTGWATGVYVQNTSDITVTGNAFTGNNVGMSADGYAGNSNLVVSGNTFTDQNLEGMGIGGVGGSWDGASSITGNTFTGPGIFNYDAALPDTIVADNTFNGTAGADTLTDDSGPEQGHIGDSTIEGGDGEDTVDYSFATADIAVDIEAGTATASGAEIGTDTLNSIERFVTGAGNDTFTYALGAGDVEIDGNGGSDTLIVDGTGAAGSHDYDVAAGSLDITIDGGGTPSVHADDVEKLTLNLGAHGDTVTLTGDMAASGLGTAKAGNLINGGSGDDIVDASGLTSATGLTLALGDGDDTVKMGRGNDTLGGGAGDHDLIDLSHITANTVVNLDAGTASGSEVGADTVTGFEDIRGGAGKDFLTGNGVANIFYASAGDDVIDGKGGTDTYDASGTAGPVTIDLATGYASSAGGVPTLTSIENALGGLGDDFIYGSSVANRLEGGAGEDTINGSGGDDILVGGDDDDALDGGADSDTAVFAGNLANFTVDYLAGTVTDNVGSGGTDSVANIEFLQFDDGTVAWDDFAPSLVGNPQIDFNGSMSADILSIHQVSGNISWRDGASPGTVVNVGDIPGREFLAVADFNGDGKGDLFLMEGGTGWMSYLKSGDAALATDIGAIAGRHLVAVGDFDGNGQDDILLADDATEWLSFLPGGDGNSSTDVGFILGRDLLAIADIDGDGSDDLLLSDQTTGWLSYVPGGNANAPVDIGFTSGRDLVSIGDFNGDGSADLLLEDQVTGWLSYIPNGDVNTPVDIGFITGRELVGVGDFNGDGLDDLLLFDGSANWASYLVGGTNTPVDVGSTAGLAFVGIDDFDGDGLDDILLRDTTTDALSFASQANMGSVVAVGDYTDVDVLVPGMGLDFASDLLIA